MPLLSLIGTNRENFTVQVMLNPIQAVHTCSMTRAAFPLVLLLFLPAPLAHQFALPLVLLLLLPVPLEPQHALPLERQATHQRLLQFHPHLFVAAPAMTKETLPHSIIVIARRMQPMLPALPFARLMHAQVSPSARQPVYFTHVQLPPTLPPMRAAPIDSTMPAA